MFDPNRINPNIKEPTMEDLVKTAEDDNFFPLDDQYPEYPKPLEVEESSVVFGGKRANSDSFSFDAQAYVPINDGEHRKFGDRPYFDF